MENETHCIETLVNPAKGGTETLWLLMVTAVILIGCGTAIGMRMHTNYEKRIETWQIDAFAELEAGEISIFNALQAAAEEINATHILEGDYWVSVAELEELYVPPFAHDAAWHKQGKIQWAMKMVATDDRLWGTLKLKKSNLPFYSSCFMIIKKSREMQQWGPLTPHMKFG